MELKKELSITRSKKDVEKIVREVLKNKDLYQKLLLIFFEGDYRTSQKASWVLTHCTDIDKTLIEPYLNEIVSKLETSENNTVKRNVVRILQSIDIPVDLEGKVADICFNFLESKEAIAVKVFSMNVLHNISQKYPELKKELKVMIEDQLPYAAPAFKSRGLKILKTLR